MRSVREAYRTGVYGDWRTGELTLTSRTGSRYAVFFRDVVPGEDSAGLIHQFD